MKRFGLAAIAGLVASVVFVFSLAPLSRQAGAVSPSQPSPTNHPAGSRAPKVAVSLASPIAVGRTISANSTTPATTTSRPAEQSPPGARRPWDPAWFESLRGTAVGDVIRIELLNGLQASGLIRHLRHENNQVVYVTGEVTAPERGRFFFQKQSLPGVAGAFVGVVEMPGSQRAYRLEPSGTGDSMDLVERPLKQVLCIALPLPETAAGAKPEVEEIPPLKPGDFPTLPIPGYQKGIVRLQSLPGARAVVYLDFQGGSTPTWGGITYARPSMSNNQIREVWVRVAEDYMPFQVNITTDLAVYEAAAENSRQRVVITPTSTAQPGSGGVAYMNSFNWTGDTPAWVFLTTPKDCAEACSHELGHTLGLSHDGKEVNGSLTEYYGGQGSGDLGWAPVMGVGYGRNVSQWSKGEYSGANNTEDDLLIITTRNNNMQYRVDDTAGVVTSRYLDIQPSFVVAAQGVIERSGDVDAFNFSTRGGLVTLRGDPVSTGPNLAVRLALHKLAGDLVLAANPAGTLWASLSTNLPAGDYTLRVTGSERGAAVSTGFSAYGSLGYYSISGTVANAVVASRFAVAENSPAGTVAGVVDVNNPDQHPLSFRIAAGNSAGAFAIDEHGVLTVASEHALDYEALGRTSQLPVQFELFVEIIDEQDGSLTDLSRRVVIGVSDVNEYPIANGFETVLLQGTRAGTVFGAVTASDPDAYTLLSYSLTSGNDNEWFKIDSATGELSTGQDLPKEAIGRHQLAVRVFDQPTTAALSVTSIVEVTVVANSSGLRPGSITYAAYTNVPGSSLASLTNSSRFPLDPAYEKELTQFEGGRDVDDRFGAAMRGYVIPPVSGQYKFFIASDDSSQLWLSTSTNPSAMSLVASVSDGFWTSPREWTRYTSQQSKGINLVAGKAYYIEARMREGTGNDHLAVAWESLNNGIKREVIPGRCLAPHHLNYVPRTGNISVTVHRDALSGSRVGTLHATDANSGDTHTYSLISGGGEILSLERATGILRVADEAALLSTPQTSLSLSIRVEDDGVPTRSTVSTVSVKLVATNAVTATTPQQEFFWGVGTGTSVANLTNNAKYPRRPDALVPMEGLVGHSDAGENYGSRMRALLVPAISGTYYLHLSSDDSSVLRLSSTALTSDAKQVAAVSGYTAPDQWNKYPSQRSAAVSLVAGRSYYIETLHKQSGSLDHVTVAWSGPALVGTNPIPASVLRPINLNYAPTAADRNAQLPRNATNGTFVAAVSAQDATAELLAYKIVSGNESGTFQIDPDTGRIIVVDDTVFADFQESRFTLGVLVQDSGYGGLFPRRSATASVTITIQEPDEYLWSGAGESEGWDDAQNWVAGVVPPERARLKFAGTTRQANVNNLLSVLGPVTLDSGGFEIVGNPVRLLAGMTSSGDNAWAVDSMLHRSQGFTNLAGKLSILGRLDLNSNALHLIATDQILCAGSISGEGRLVKTGLGELTLSGSNHLAGSLELREGSTRLAGAEAVFSLIQVQAGATLAAGSDASRLTIPPETVLSVEGLIKSPTTVRGELRAGPEGLATFEESLELAGLIEVLLHRTTEIIEADVFEVRGSLAQGGVLRVSLKGEPLLAGDQFQLFRAQSITGQFQAVELPELTEGVRWDLTSLGSHGLLRVVAAAAVPQVASVRSNASGELELEIPTAVGQTYELQETGSLGASSDWRTLSAHAGNGLSLKLTVPFDASRPSRFFRFKID